MMRPARRGTALVGVAALLSSSLAMGAAAADESGSPSAVPATTTTELQAANPDWSPPATVDTYVGQSVQVRKNADGFQNSDLANFRWTVTQVNAETLNGLDVAVPLPMADAPGLRSLTGRSNMPTEVEGGVVYGFDGVDGIQTKRTLNLWPQDQDLPVDVKAEFTLNGEAVTADQIIGKGGLVTAKYTIVNKTVKDEEVAFTNVQGEEDTEEVATSQAFVGISKQFIPQSWAQFDPGNGIFGADGRGNFQTQWITLAFLPFAEDGQASFGWSAVIPDGQGFIPKMVIEVSPLYVPLHASEQEQTATSSNGVPRPNTDAAMASVQSGVEDLVAGVSSLADTINEATGVTKEGVSAAVSQVKAAIDKLCGPDLLDCANKPDKPPVSESISQVVGQLTQLSAGLQEAIDAINAGNTDPGEAVAELTKARDKLVNEVIPKVDDVQSAVEGLNNSMNNWVGENCGNPSVTPQDATTTAGDLTGACSKVSEWIGQTGTIAGLLEGVKGLLSDVVRDLDSAIANIPAGLANLQVSTLSALKDKVDGVTASLKDLLTYLGQLAGPLGELQAGIDQIGAAIDAGGAILGDVGSSLDQIASGRAQISAGLGKAGDQVSAYVAEVVATAQAAAEQGKEAAAEVEAQANTIKAEMAGLKGRMAQSPLPYGGGMNTVYADGGNQDAVQEQAVQLVSTTDAADTTDGVQPTTELFGAYQFLLDPADRNQPNTPWRIALAVVFVVGAGLLATRVARRR